MLSSMSHKIAARYECDGKEVPRVLWRVRYTGQSLKARAKPAFKTKKQFKRAVELHLNWSNRIPTPFVALFGTREHAVNWAKSHFELGYDDVFLLKIDASKLGPIFQVRYLVQDSDIHTLLPESIGSESLKARSRPSFKSTSELKTTVELHLKWCNCEPIPFVSLLANEDHAMSWSQCLLEHGYHDVFVVEINSSRLLSLFWVQELVNHQGVATNLPPAWRKKFQPASIEFSTTKARHSQLEETQFSKPTLNAEFKTAVQDHLDWYNRQPTPFVSTFADYQHALNWANRLIDNGRARQVMILELDAFKRGWLFSVLKNGHITTHLPENMYQDEYLVLSSISSQSIISKIVVSRRDLIESSSDEDEQASDSDDLGVNFAACQTKKQLEVLDWTSMETDCTKTEWTTLFEDLRDFTNQEEAAVSIVLDDVSALKWQFGDAAVLDFVRCCKTLTHENNVSVMEAGDLVHFPAIADMATVVLSTKPLSTGYSKDIHGTTNGKLPIRRSDIELTTVCIALGRMRCLTEVELLKQLPTHPNIVGFREAFWMQHLDETQQLLVLVLELADGGDLEQYLRGSSIKEEEARRIFLQIAQGVNHLHRHRVIHRDLKSGNVFLFGSGRVVLGDFGTSKLLPTTAGADQFLEAQGLTSTVVGSPLFMSPELLEGESHGFATDIWSLGCVLYEMLSGGKPAFCAPSYPAVVFRITQGEYDPLDTTLVSSEARDLVDKILRKDPKNRPNITEVLQLPWLQAPNTRNEGSPADHLPAKGVITATNCQETIAGQQEMNSDVLESSILKPTTSVAQSNTPPAAPIVNKIVEVSPPPVPQTLDEQPPPPPILPSKANFSTVSSIPFKHHHLQHHRQTIPELEIRGVHITGTARHNSANSILKS
ncbi:Protein kinase-like domain [Phytophthora cactorum]|nr:Protein kinase-like domain [Phytophthora cactorum]